MTDMLYNFTVKNFRSISNLLSIELLSKRSATNTIKDEEVTETSWKSTYPGLHLTFGSVGAGKTNVIEALQTLRSLLVPENLEVQFTYKNHYIPFESSYKKRQPTLLSVTIRLDVLFYKYTITYNERQTLEEVLESEDLIGQNRQTLFRYQKGKIKQAINKASPIYCVGLIKAVEDCLEYGNESKPLLSLAALHKISPCLEIQNWFINNISFAVNFKPSILEKTSRLKNPKTTKKLIIKLLQTVDPTIKDVRGSLIGEKNEGIDISKSIEFMRLTRNGKSIWTEGAGEASGVMNQFYLVYSILTELHLSKLVIFDGHIDQIDMHAASHALQMINTISWRSKKSQYWITTKNSDFLTHPRLPAINSTILTKNCYLSTEACKFADAIGT